MALSEVSASDQSRTELARQVAAALEQRFERIVRHAGRIKLLPASAESEADYVLTIRLTRVERSVIPDASRHADDRTYRWRTNARITLMPSNPDRISVPARSLELGGGITVNSTQKDAAIVPEQQRRLVEIQGGDAADAIALELGFATFSSINDS